MTNNQINYLSLEETRRANRVKEGISLRDLSEKSRHNERTEVETERSNRAKEHEAERSNRARESFNILNLAETRRANLAKETETNRSSVAKENEAKRHNRWTEALDYSKQSGLPLIYTPEMVERDASLKNALYMPDAKRVSGWIESKVPTFGDAYDSIRDFFGIPHKSSSGATHGGKGGQFAN